MNAYLRKPCRIANKVSERAAEAGLDGLCEKVHYTIPELKALSRLSYDEIDLAIRAKALPAKMLGASVEREAIRYSKSAPKNGRNGLFTRDVDSDESKFDVGTVFVLGKDLLEYVVSGKGDSLPALFAEATRFTREEEKELTERIREGDFQAQSEFLESNIGLTYRATELSKTYSMPADDKDQESFIGMMKATHRFRGERGFKFSTYSLWWMKQKISKSFKDNYQEVSLPVHALEAIYRVNRIVQRSVIRTGEEPSDEEILRKAKISKELLEKIRSNNFVDIVSLEKRVGVGEETELKSFLPAKATETYETYSDRKKRDEAISEVLGDLNDVEKDVILSRFGLSGREAIRYSMRSERPTESQERG